MSSSRGVAAVEDPGQPSERSAFEAFWDSIDESVREAFEAEAVTATSAFLKKQYLEGRETLGPLWRATRERILLAYFTRTHEGRGPVGRDP